MSVLWGFIRNRWSAPPLESLSSSVISGKTVLVTGASAGLGLEAARHYAKLGAARLVLGVRSQKKGDEAKAEIEKSLTALGNGKRVSVQIDIWILDLASYTSVQGFAKRVVNELDTLDIAVLNAAVTKSQFVLTKDGWEETLQVNTLSTLLLGLLLLPKLRETTKNTPGWTSRLEFVASRAHQIVKEGDKWQTAPNFLDMLNQLESFSGSNYRYAVSKLLLIYGIREVTAIADDTNGKPAVIVNYTCPGACRSDLAREWHGWASSLILWLIQVTICKTAEEGSRTLVYASCLGEDSHGKWIHNDRIEE